MPRSSTSANEVASSYEEALVIAAMDQATGLKSKKVDEASVLFNETLASLAPVLRELQFKYAMRVGKILHRLYAAKGDLIYKINPNLGLVEFLESVGYRYVLNKSFEEVFNITMFIGRKAELGFMAHNFESGMISGYASSAGRRVLMARESSCMCNSSGACSFVSGQGMPAYPIDVEKATERFSAYVRERLGGKALERSMSAEYCQMLWDSLLHRSYANELNQITYYFGSRVSKALKGTSRRSVLRELESTISLLNLGTLRLNSAKPLSATLAFDRYLSKKDFAEMAASFAKGFLEAKGFVALDLREEGKGGRYAMSIKEGKLSG